MVSIDKISQKFILMKEYLGILKEISEIPENMRPLHNTILRHSGLDPESRKYLKTLDSGLRRNDKMIDFL